MLSKKHKCTLNYQEDLDMPFEEFVLYVLGLFAFAVFSGLMIGAQSSNPLKSMATLLASSVIIVVCVALIGLLCYAIAWAWRNPLIVIGMAICGFLAYRYFWVRPKCASV